ncbi:MAG: PEP-CTERM sorting domain-containing protein [Nitrospira sp.]|nr:PEP-CTERM sorting domain-containing protein [Nitrospira sp.]
MKIKHYVIFALLVILLTPIGVFATTCVPSSDFSYSETSLGGGYWQFDYTLSNTTDVTNPLLDCTGYDIFQVELTFPSDLIFTHIGLPTDWQGAGLSDEWIAQADLIDPSLAHATAWSIAPGAIPVGADIPPGLSLSTYSFKINTSSGNFDYEVLFNDPNDVNNPIVLAGVTAPLTAVPEPATLLLLGTALAVVGISGSLRKARHSK